MSRHRIIVGVDFGTTFTGVSYVDSSKNHINDITVIRTWPGPTREQDEVCKTPSRIAYKCENPSLSEEAAWGYQVEPKMKSYSWMKLLLDSQRPNSLTNDTWDTTNGDGLMRIPPFKSEARDVCADYLREIYKHIIIILEKRHTPEVLKVTPLDFWFTIPAIWSDKAKEDTLNVAIDAGFKSRSTDDITIITEPEAAAIATLTTLSDEESRYDVKSGDIILICDCGGGTVDIITYLVNQTSPVFKFEELLVGTGGKCGSTFIDRNFHKWMARTFKSAWESLKPERKGSGSRFMREFEGYKRDFGTPSTLNKTFELDLVIPNAPESEYYNLEDGGTVGRSNPPTKTIQAFVKNKDAKVVLAGGFGDSPYLNQMLRTWCEARGMSLMCPGDPQASVVKGAALAGLKNSRPQTRKSRLHYGVIVGEQFREGIDPPDTAYHCKWDGLKRCNNRMEWIIQKGASIGKEDKITYPLSTIRSEGESLVTILNVYTCQRDYAPEWYAEESCRRVGELHCKFQESDLTVFEKKKHPDGRDMWRMEFRVGFDLFADKGILQFHAIGPNKKNLGEISIEYD
ncbi:hypothetical protein N7493_010264 [Penicillium malachiteum]|uniref:Actin-like ATPase domain-containing protein n=1 Tax=Penicillium malachiteum TaxID=1324776 RepID=A0AAD6HCL1_9EURO|nr:hypothetical protein N7493_010264 [Penicillium malachiteum]